jgi:hypothetical protein
MRRADRCRKGEHTGRDPGDRELETCDLTAHSIFRCSKDLKWLGLACSKPAGDHIPITLACILPAFLQLHRLHSRNETLDGALLNSTRRRLIVRRLLKNSRRALSTVSYSGVSCQPTRRPSALLLCASTIARMVRSACSGVTSSATPFSIASRMLA